MDEPTASTKLIGLTILLDPTGDIRDILIIAGNPQGEAIVQASLERIVRPHWMLRLKQLWRRGV